MKNNRITKTEVVQGLRSGRTTTVNACRTLRKMGRYTGALSQAEQKKLHRLDNTKFEDIKHEDMNAYASLLLKAVPREGSAERPKPTPKAKVVKKATPVRPVSAATMARVKFAAAAEKLKNKILPFFGASS